MRQTNLPHRTETVGLCVILATARGFVSDGVGLAGVMSSLVSGDATIAEPPMAARARTICLATKHHGPTHDRIPADR